MRNEREKYREQEGFTLVELDLRDAIMGILMAIAVPSYNHFQERSAKQVAIANADPIMSRESTAGDVRCRCSGRRGNTKLLL